MKVWSLSRFPCEFVKRRLSKPRPGRIVCKGAPLEEYFMLYYLCFGKRFYFEKVKNKQVKFLLQTVVARLHYDYAPHKARMCPHISNSLWAGGQVMAIWLVMKEFHRSRMALQALWAQSMTVELDRWSDYWHDLLILINYMLLTWLNEEHVAESGRPINHPPTHCTWSKIFSAF